MTGLKNKKEMKLDSKFTTTTISIIIDIITRAVIVKYLGRVCVLHCLFPLVCVCSMFTQLL